MRFIVIVKANKDWGAIVPMEDYSRIKAAREAGSVSLNLQLQELVEGSDPSDPAEIPSKTKPRQQK